MSETEVTTEVQFDDNDNLDAFSDDFFGRKPVAADTSTNVDAEQDADQPEDEGTDAQNGDDQAAETETEDEAPVEPEPKKKQTAQDRINELVKQREDQKRDFEARIEALRKEIDEKLNASKLKPEPVKEAAEPTPTDLKEDGTEKYPLGEFDPQYIRDLTRFTLNQEQAQLAKAAEEQRKVQEETQAREALTSSWNAKVEASKESYPDFVEKGQALLSGFGNLDEGYAGYLSTVLMSMDKGPDVLYYLANHPDEATAIVNSGAQKATLALGRIEAKFIEADAQKVLAKPKVSKAPPPPPVRARGTNGAFISVAPDTDDLDDFERAFFSKKK